MIPSDSKHTKTSDLSRHLCDLMLACLPDDLEPSRIFSSTWCGAHINTRKAALYWVGHSRKHIEVFLRCGDAPEIVEAIQSKLPSGVSLKQRPHPRKGIAITTPLFFFVRTEEQARKMGHVLQMLSSLDFKATRQVRDPAARYWTPNSEEARPTLDSNEEGNRVVIAVNKYERNRKNRERCIKHYGPICFACGFDFSVIYGEIGSGYIHVHHLTPLAVHDGKSLKVDPIKDLRPVCPNCHEMLHRIDPPYTIDQLKVFLVTAKAGSE